MDPLRSDLRAAEALTDGDRDARIEQLLLGGLDSYFAGEYDQAINLWTRVLFFDRHHRRARAYIERARSAQAERQRESEAVLHQGIEAFHDGDVALARRLIADALARGASPDEAQSVLTRIERLGIGQIAPARGSVKPVTFTLDATAEETPDETRRPAGWSAGALLLTAALGVLAVAVWGIISPEPAAWSFLAPAVSRSDARVMPMTLDPLPVPAAGESSLARARAFYMRGQLRDALTELDRISTGDRSRPAADRLRADIQRHLLALAAAETSAPPPE
jgi:tetratricopeptide (TPR) repeat protein